MKKIFLSVFSCALILSLAFSTYSLYMVMKIDRMALEQELIKSDINDLHSQLNVESIGDKNILILGDSISDEQLFPDCWVKDFKTMCESVNTTVTNHSLQGRTIGSYEGADNTLIKCLDTVPNGDYDYIIVFLGINDWQNQVDLGYLGDDNSDSVWNSIGQFQEWHIDNYPNAKVTFITPLKSNVENLKHKLTQFYVKTIICGAEYYGFQVIDAHSFAPLITDATIEDWTIDGLHPNEKYSRYLAEYIFDNLSSQTSSVGIDMIHTTLAVTDANITSWHVYTDYDGTGSICYRINDFSANGEGNILVAELPEESQSSVSLYGTGTIISGDYSYIVTIYTDGEKIYCIKPSNVPDGELYGTLNGGYVRFALQYINTSV